MTELLDRQPYEPRDDATFLKEMNALTRLHLDHCKAYAQVWPNWQTAKQLEDLPFLHVGVFKHILFRTESPAIKHGRELHSSSTTGQQPSRIVLDNLSSKYQTQSNLSILRDLVGKGKRPLLILDSSQSLRQKGSVSARIMAAMSLQPLASELHFLMADADDPETMNWNTVSDLLDRHDQLLVYGFTWVLWLAWGGVKIPDVVLGKLKDKVIHFVHSGGWKKLEEQKIDRKTFNVTLLEKLDSNSAVIDYYGLVEQVGVIYPLCSFGYRHVPVWAGVLVRDAYTLQSVKGEVGQLQFLNVLARGAPYHSVLTEDLGRIIEGECPCGRHGRRFEFVGRIPKAEVRGCANV